MRDHPYDIYVPQSDDPPVVLMLRRRGIRCRGGMLSGRTWVAFPSLLTRWWGAVALGLAGYSITRARGWYAPDEGYWVRREF